MLSYKIIAGLNKRDKESIAEVWKMFYPYVFTNVSELIGNSSDVEGIAYEITIKLLERKEPFENLENIRSYTYKAVQNACSNYLKRRDNMEINLDELDENLNPIIKPEDLEAAETVTALRTRIFKIIQELPPKCREVFMLYYSRQMKDGEIAGHFGITIKAVEKHKTKAFKKLKIRLGPRDQFILSIIFL